MSDPADIDILDISDEASFARIPPCADPTFDHRSCDYWEDDLRGKKASRPHWWEPGAALPHEPDRTQADDNPFAAPAGRREGDFNPFSTSDAGRLQDPSFNPFAPAPSGRQSNSRRGPRKLSLLGRGEGVFGSYAKVLRVDGESAVYAQFGPLSAYPRAQQIRESYPKLPQSPLPAVVTCIATTPAARGRSLGARLVAAVCADLAARGFAAIEAYPDLTLDSDKASSATPGFWESCGFKIVADDERYPVLRRELD